MTARQEKRTEIGPIFAIKGLTSSALSGIVRALAARYGTSVSGRLFENRALSRAARFDRNPPRMEARSFSLTIKSLKTKEKYRGLVFFVI
jgi:hypothetical protein